MKEKAILVAVNLNNQEGFTNSIEELKNLSIGLDIDVLDVLTQNLSHIAFSFIFYLPKINHYLY